MQNKLRLNAETLRNLSAQEISGVVGGTTEFTNPSDQTICVDCAGGGGDNTQTKIYNICAINPKV